ncbi:hypothetical protein BDZ45DRAFT_472677 [Acephala macrosclerotiorum]|nr:hypothetical protein BDZ45DRAFT_472677 [Acephala macrosclerotiorum]
MNGTTGEEELHDGLAVANDAETMPESKPTSTTLSDEDLTTRALRFLSTATTETICGIAVGLAASTYLVLGRVGLVLIGALGGVVLHATWEEQTPAPIGEARKEKGIDVVKRLLDLRDAQDKDEYDDEDSAVVGSSFEGFQPETAAALNELTDAVIRDYVKWWYGPILPKDNSFPAAARQTFVKLLLSISLHMSRKRPADTFLDFLTNSSSIVIVFLNELSSAFSASQGSNVPPAEAVYTYLSANPESNLANVLNQRQQAKKFKMVAEDILQNFLEKSAYDCDPARAFLREALAGLVLEMALQSCSKPEWINGWIVYLLEEGEPDFSQAIDAGVGGGDDLLSNPFNDFDGNVGNIRIARTPRSQVEKEKSEVKKHKKRLSKAEEAMEEAMEEAKRLSQLIAEEDAKKRKAPQNALVDAPPVLVEAVQQNAESLHLNMSALTNNQPSTSDIKSPASTQSLVSRSAEGTENTNEKAVASNGFTVPKSATSQQRPMSKASESSFSNKSSSPTSSQSHKPFTSFDQIVPQSAPLALQEDPPARRKPLPLTLYNANVTILDDSTGADKGRLRSKPNAELLIQVEPASSDHPGWMTIRRYPDFEPLHEILRRIAQISGVTAFTEQHQTLPGWKEHTKSSLRGELERYLRDACWYKELAESDAMKRFLEKDQGNSMGGGKNAFPGIGWPTPSAFESMGKGMLDVLASAPKGVAQGGKAIGGGLTGVFNNIGSLSQKTNGSSNNLGMHTPNRSSTSTLPRMDSMSSISAPRASRVSEESLRAAPIVSTQPSTLPAMERRPSYNSIAEEEGEREPRPPTSARSSMSGRRSTTQSRDASRAPSRKGTPLSSPTQGIIGEMKLPLPSEMPEEGGSQTDASTAAQSRAESTIPPSRTSTSTAPSQQSPTRPSMSSVRRPSIPVSSSVPQAPALPRRPRKEATPLSEAETRVAVELLFAVINEMYTLSSAWNIRRTLLTAAKTFLLRPGNPSLSSIQTLIQDSVIAANTTDTGIAAHLKKLRENTLPTEAELKAWPAEMSSEEKERLRIKARKLLVERGVPAALTGVMGQAATGEAMGRIFDCLQVEEVARGLMFGLLLQGLRAVTQ